MNSLNILHISDAHIQIKLNPEKSATLSKAFKGNKSIVRKEVAKQIEKSQSIEL